MEIDLNESVSRTITILKYAQVWPYSSSRINKIWKVFLFTSEIVHTLTQFIFVYQNRADLEKNSMALFMAIACILSNIKVAVFQINFQKILPTIQELSKQNYQPNSRTEKNMLLLGIQKSKLVQLVTSLFVVASLLLFYLSPVLSHWTTLACSAWFPYDPFTPVSYWITVFWQSFSALFIVISTFALDVLFWCLMLQIGTQCDVICVKILDLENSERLRQDLHRIITHHQIILK